MLAAQVQSRTIDGVTYLVTPLPAGVALRMAARVLKMAAPAFSDVGSLVKASQAVTSALEALASGLLADLDEEVLTWCASEFAKVTQYEVNGARLALADSFDLHFQGRFTSMLSWLVFAAQVTFPFVAKAAPAPAVAAAAG